MTTTGATCPSPPTSLACGDLVLASGGVVDNESYAHVGHGGEPVDAGAGVFGTEVSAAGGITLEVAGEISLVDGLDPVVDFWWIGHLMTIPATISGAEVSLDTATLDFDDATSSPSATVDDDQFWPRFVGDGGASGEADNVSGGAVILRVRGGAGDDGNLVSQRSLAVPGGTTNPVILRSTDDLTISAAVTNDGSSRIDLVDDDATADQTPPGLSTTALLTIDAGGSIGGAGEVRAFAVTPGQFTAGSWSPPAQQFGVWYDTFGVPVVGVNFKTGTDLTITKTDGVTTATPGGAVTYTITAANSGPANAPGAMVADTFPAALTCTWACGGTGGGACTAAGAGNIADLVDLPAGGSVTYTASCTISAAASGSLVNTATVTAPAGVTDTASGNNSATDTDSLSAAPAADLSATKTVSGSFTPGGAITYLLVLSNTGTADQADNPGDELTDVLPASLTLVSASATSGTAVANVGMNTVTWNGSIPTGGSVTITIHAIVGAAVPGGTTVSNQATFAFDADHDGTNESAGVSDDPGVGGVDDPTTFEVAAQPSPTEIPALGEIGLLAFAALLAGLGALHLRRRRSDGWGGSTIGRPLRITGGSSNR